MKCPKCGYLGFERGDRCRNCGYDFSLASPPSEALDLVLDPGPEHLTPPLDLDRVIGAPDPEALGDLPLFGASQSDAAQRALAARRAAGLATNADDMPLISASHGHVRRWVCAGRLERCRGHVPARPNARFWKMTRCSNRLRFRLPRSVRRCTPKRLPASAISRPRR